MRKIKLFTDSSVNPQKKIGFGAFLEVSDENLIFDVLRKNIKIKKFEDTSSTKLELETLIWALDEISVIDENSQIEVYTDCQNIISLQNRREKFEINDYKTSTGKTINNYELYKLFFEKTDEINIEFIKVKGHKKSSLKDEIDKVFNLVDRASRNALRKNI
ncbi:ribonuclease HI [Aliarcobacter thereius]|uniref:Ribonuclease H n=1 Tax=Aliarcobacter thereius LMG 24486 TaxID=1032240 RepID=A0A1C7WTU1_9BACT|nr:RNase H family protein [Aliarcobacter thereius]OCL90143.1 ribonuclease H [Aliarcobacter thereius]OCL96257.1 ribonuclease H [Aliarcobacter thereius LMG 24486]QBF15778.1 ribonuclease H family protein [Aliarcobacter thereius LMG 24486]TLS92443.1 ribonuclease H [Aliarcobacter thereius]